MKNRRIKTLILLGLSCTSLVGCNKEMKKTEIGEVMELVNNNANIIEIQCPYTDKSIHEKFEDCYAFTTGDIRDIYEYREYLNALGYDYPKNIGWSIDMAEVTGRREDGTKLHLTKAGKNFTIHKLQSE